MSIATTSLKTLQRTWERSNQKDEIGNRMVANTEANGRFHSDWVSMLYPRLKLARNLLREDGVIFVSIADHEIHNLRIIMSEIFGAYNFVATIIWQKVFSPKNSARHFSEDHDYIVVYAKHGESWTSIAASKNWRHGRTIFKSRQ